MYLFSKQFFDPPLLPILASSTSAFSLSSVLLRVWLCLRGVCVCLVPRLLLGWCWAVCVCFCSSVCCVAVSWWSVARVSLRCVSHGHCSVRLVDFFSVCSTVSVSVSASGSALVSPPVSFLIALLSYLRLCVSLFSVLSSPLCLLSVLSSLSLLPASRCNRFCSNEFQLICSAWFHHSLLCFTNLSGVFFFSF